MLIPLKWQYYLKIMTKQISSAGILLFFTLMGMKNFHTKFHPDFDHYLSDTKMQYYVDKKQFMFKYLNLC